jgi:hypothetical protein
MASSCAGIPKGAIPDLEEPKVITPPKCPSVQRIVKDGQAYYQFSEADALAIAKHREELAGEVIKGQEGMRAYRRLLEKCLGR